MKMASSIPQPVSAGLLYQIVQAVTALPLHFCLFVSSTILSTNTCQNNFCAHLLCMLSWHGFCTDKSTGFPHFPRRWQSSLLKHAEGPISMTSHSSLVLLSLTLLAGSGFAARPVQAQTFTNQSVSAFANIFGAGNAANPTPNPGGGTGGTIAPEFDLAPGSGRTLTFSSVVGVISFTPGVSSVPDGLMPDGSAPLNLDTNITSYQGISGIQLEKGSGFLVGVFLPSAAPTALAPARLTFTNNGSAGLIDTSFVSISPLLDQTFFVGDGLTGNGNGSRQQFLVPDGASRLFLGYADANGYNGAPGQYQDNGGSVTASFQISSPVPETSSVISFGLLLVLGLGGAAVAARRRKSAGVA